jgi:hypothetical protein
LIAAHRRQLKGDMDDFFQKKAPVAFLLNGLSLGSKQEAMARGHGSADELGIYGKDCDDRKFGDKQVDRFKYADDAIRRTSVEVVDKEDEMRFPLFDMRNRKVPNDLSQCLEVFIGDVL